jgi:hypothetical protein
MKDPCTHSSPRVRYKPSSHLRGENQASLCSTLCTWSLNLVEASLCMFFCCFQFDKQKYCSCGWWNLMFGWNAMVFCVVCDEKCVHIYKGKMCLNCLKLFNVVLMMTHFWKTWTFKHNKMCAHAKLPCAEKTLACAQNNQPARDIYAARGSVHRKIQSSARTPTAALKPPARDRLPFLLFRHEWNSGISGSSATPPTTPFSSAPPLPQEQYQRHREPPLSPLTHQTLTRPLFVARYSWRHEITTWRWLRRK